MEATGKVFENTFEKACKNKTLTVSAIITGLGHGLFKYTKLPQEVRDAVDAEMERRERIAAGGSTWRPDSDEAWKLDILDACLVPRQNPTGARKVVSKLMIELQDLAPAIPIPHTAQVRHGEEPLVRPRRARSQNS